MKGNPRLVSRLLGRSALLEVYCSSFWDSERNRYLAMAEGEGKGGREKTPVYQLREDPGFDGYESLDSSVSSARSLIPRPVIRGKYTFCV